MQNLNSNNYSQSLNSWIKQNKVTLANIARAINCSIPTLNRLLKNHSYPTNEMLRQTGIMMTVGFAKYSKMSKAQKEKYSEGIGSVSGAGLGFASISAVVGSLGVGGLSGPGIMSGLATAGGFVGGGAAIGVAAIAVVPLVGAGLGYGLIKGIKWAISGYNSKIEKIDARWETGLR